MRVSVSWIELSTIIVLITCAALLLWWHVAAVALAQPAANATLWALLLTTVYAALCFCAFRADAAPATVAHHAGAKVQVAYASQTGFAEQLSTLTCSALNEGGMQARTVSLASLDAKDLVAARQLLFVVSTTGEGDAPDSAARFVRTHMHQQVDLRGLRYGVLALGDSDYANFCAFGRELDHWLHACGAQAMFDRIEVDDGDPGALRHWQHQLGMLSGSSELPDWQEPGYQDWRLQRRTLLNPGSVGGACHHLSLVPADAAHLEWQAGDIAEIGPCHASADVSAWLARSELDGAQNIVSSSGMESLQTVLARSHMPTHDSVVGLDEQTLADTLKPLPHREYSIASIPTDGAIHLLVREMHHEDGRPGIGSAWLTRHASTGSTIKLRVRSNPNFHLSGDAQPLILIGNGTGIAGLRALLKARIAADHKRNWLLFGERNAAHDKFYSSELMASRDAGDLVRLDLVYSRDQPTRVYVQDRLREAAGMLRDWVADGASIHVCGSLQGMSTGVTEALEDILGTHALQAMQDQGRYRRDVY